MNSIIPKVVSTAENIVDSGKKVIQSASSKLQETAPDSAEFTTKQQKAVQEEPSNVIARKFKELKTKIREEFEDLCVAPNSRVRSDLISTANRIKTEQFATNIPQPKYKSREDVVNFLRSNFGIQEIDENMPGYVLSWVAEGMRRTNNAHNGFLALPKKITYIKEAKPTTRASVNFEDNSININPDVYSEKGVRLSIQNLIRFMKTGYMPLPHCRIVPEGKEYYYKSINMRLAKVKVDPKVDELLHKYDENPNSLTVPEMFYLSETATQIQIQAAHRLNDAKDCIKGKFSIEPKDCFNPIYHELGHYQYNAAMYENMCKELDGKKFGLGVVLKNMESSKDTSENWAIPFTKFGNFVLNPLTQYRAGKVSYYAKTGIQEFLAETFALAMQGEKLPKNVIKMYKQYGGTPVPNTCLA